MVDKPTYVIEPAKLEDFDQIMPLWSALYEHEARSGMVYALRDDAAELWRRDAESRLGGRFFFLFVAREEESRRIDGFLAGKFRRRPSIYEMSMVATFTELYVKPEARGNSLARRLIEFAFEGIRERGIRVVDAMPVAGNVGSQALWKSMGWELEFTQYRYDL